MPSLLFLDLIMCLSWLRILLDREREHILATSRRRNSDESQSHEDDMKRGSDEISEDEKSSNWLSRNWLRLYTVALSLVDKDLPWLAEVPGSSIDAHCLSGCRLDLTHLCFEVGDYALIRSLLQNRALIVSKSDQVISSCSGSKD